MRRELPEIRKAGAELYVVGSGRPDQAKDFLETTGLEATVFCDKSLDAFKLAGLKRGLLRTFNPLVGLNMLRALARGHVPAKTAGDPLQQGGALVVTPARRVVYHHANAMAGEALPVADIMDAVRRAAAA